jgi:hypothetical protein
VYARAYSWGALLIGCGAPAKGPGLSADEALDPAACQGCHPAHVAEWAGSMHAYAGDDPIFRAMNARGQRETDGALGDGCVVCHAPTAARLGLTDDGLNLDEVDPGLRGVGCVACHAVDGVTGVANHALTFADEVVMRGGIEDPIATPAHGSAWSRLHDRRAPASSGMCGACHDLVTPSGFPLERTYAEWTHTLFAEPEPGKLQTCGGCHMEGLAGRSAEVPGAPARGRHDHRMPGVDIALIDWPDRAAQAAAVQASLDTTVQTRLEVFDYGGGTGVQLTLDNVGAGHHFPSGAAHHRRAWVELVAEDADGLVIWSTGVLDAGEDVEAAAAEDPALWWLGDLARGADGAPAHFTWEVASADRGGLPGPSRHPSDHPDHENPHLVRTWSLPGLNPTRVRARLHLRPVADAVLDDLVASGDLDPAVRAAVPTWTLAGAAAEWPAP